MDTAERLEARPGVAGAHDGPGADDEPPAAEATGIQPTTPAGPAAAPPGTGEDARVALLSAEIAALRARLDPVGHRVLERVRAYNAEADNSSRSLRLGNVVTAKKRLEAELHEHFAGEPGLLDLSPRRPPSAGGPDQGSLLGRAPWSSRRSTSHWSSGGRRIMR